MKKNLLVISPSRQDATSFYRGYGPFGRLRKEIENIDFIMSDGLRIDWSTMRMIDGIFMQRPFLKDHLTIMKMAEENKIPVWVDYDDDLFNVPSDNPAHDLYNNEEVQRNIATIIPMAKIVTVSTKVLQNKLSKLNNRIIVIENALDNYIFNKENYFRKDGTCPSRVVAWRGSSTHVKDLMTYGKEIIELINSHQDWVFSFIGYKPWFLIESVKNKNQIVTYDAIDVMEYHRVMYNIWPAILHVPLHFSEFNKAKSNIAWIEGTFFGSACVTPELSGWPKKEEVSSFASSLSYSSPEEYLMVMKGIMAWSDAGREKLVQNSSKCIPLLSNANKRRVEILHELLNNEVLWNLNT